MTSRMRVPAAELKRRRLEARLSREGLAQKAGLSKHTIKKIENGWEGVRPETVHALADALGCTVQELSEVDEVAS